MENNKEQKELEIKYKNQLWYYKTYNQLVDKGLKRGLDKTKLDYYVERHHILPKCLGGKNRNDNYVLFTPREHIIAHCLLAKAYPNNLGIIRSTSAILMKNKYRKDGKPISTRVISSIREHYASLKDKFSKEQLGKTISKEHRENLSKAHKGIGISQETKEKLKKSRFSIGVEGPDGTIYESVLECSRKTGHSETHIRNWAKNNLNGYKLLGNTGGRTSKNIRVGGPNGEIYQSIRECARKVGRSDRTIRNWIEKHPELGYKYLTK